MLKKLNEGQLDRNDRIKIQEKKVNKEQVKLIWARQILSGDKRTKTGSVKWDKMRIESFKIRQEITQQKTKPCLFCQIIKRG